MSEAMDVIVIGSGPAGTSAAYPLVQAGLKVLMVDGGRDSGSEPPSRSYIEERFHNEDQWKWIVGEDFYALSGREAVSPKLRVPLHRYVFDEFIRSNNIEYDNFVAVGSLAKGGLSNAWGCGVARMLDSELVAYPFASEDIEQSYEAVTRRIGVSGASEDDLSEYFGLDQWAQPPLPLDNLHKRMSYRYHLQRDKLHLNGFRLGRSRVAVLSRDVDSRKACNISSNCLWGCNQRSLYTAAYELESLARFENFHYQGGLVVDRVVKQANGVSIDGQCNGKRLSLSAKKVVLAAGTIATTRLVLRALGLESPVHLHSCPTAAFLLWMPRFLGSPKEDCFGLGQLSFSQKLTADVSAFGSTFATTGIPVTEFLRHIPLSARYGVDLLKYLLSSCVVGNVFLPGSLSTSQASLKPDGGLKISGGHAETVATLMTDASRHLRRSYRKLGAIMLPNSFTLGRPGGDIHYSCTLPMRHNPVPGETGVNGEVAGLPDVFVVDGACLPELTEKSHTLTIMANADRIGRFLAGRMMSH
jgi:choline dehydrogenase-like flavoprotein